MASVRRLITIGHSYVVALNRMLANEMGRQGQGRWEVHVVAPRFFHGDLRRISFESEHCESCLINVIPVCLSRYIHLMSYGPSLRGILSEAWDVVHCWEEPFIAAGGQVALWTRRSSTLVYSTFQNLAKTYPMPFRAIETYSMRQAAGWTAFGHTSSSVLERSHIYRLLPHRIIPLGVDTRRFRPNRAAGERTLRELGWSSTGPPVLGFLGRFVSEKGLLLLMSVIERLNEPCRVLLVGSGPLEGTLRDWAAQQANRVRVVTGVTHDEVPRYVNAMDILCAPSQTTPSWREQLGRMLIEAFACGVAVVASDSGEIPYVVDNAGIVVQERDEGAWIEVLSDVLSSPTRRADMAARGLERARTVYSWPVIARQYLTFFEELLDRKRHCRL